MQPPQNQQVTCPQCGSVNEVDTAFCRSCGHALNVGRGSRPPKKTVGGIPAVEEEKPKRKKQETVLGVPPPASGSSAPPPQEERNRPPKRPLSRGMTRGVSTRPGFPRLDLDEEKADADSDADEVAKARRREKKRTLSAFGGPTLLDAPKFTLEGSHPTGGRRGEHHTLKGMGLKPEAQHPSYGGPTLLEAPSFQVNTVDGEDQPKSTRSKSASTPADEKGKPAAAKPAHPAYGGPTLLDAPAFSIEMLEGSKSTAKPKPGPQTATPERDETMRDLPPLTNEAMALLDRFGGKGWREKQRDGEEQTSSSSTPAEPAEARRRSSAPADGGATLMGVPAALGHDEAESSSVPPTEDESGDTMKGIPAPDKAEPIRPGPRGRRPEGETLLGVPPPSGTSSSEPPRPASSRVRPPLTSVDPAAPPPRPSGPPTDDEVGMTMLGMPAAPGRGRSSAPPPAPFGGDAVPHYSADGARVSDWDASYDGPAPKRRGFAMVVLVLLALVALSATAVVAVYLLVLKESYQITPEVVPGGEVVRVRLSVAPAPTKAKIRFAGDERDLVDGGAEFEIPWDDVSLGENQLSAEVVEAEGATSPHEISFFLSYRAMADLGGLKAAEPFYAVRFQVAKGATLKVAGQAAATDDAGTYLHKIPLADALAGAMDEGDSVVHRVPFHVRLPNQATVIESVDTAIPRTPLTVNSPLPRTVVDQASIPCSGVTTPGARVTVNGAAVPAPTGRFTSMISLPTPGPHPVVVVATAPGKAPRTLRLEVRRVQSMAPMIADFARTVDPQLNYQALDRDPDALQGRSVRFRGRIINITPPSRGRTLMQILVGDGCPPEARCLLHVVFNGATTAGLNSHVTVYGTVLGRWQGQNERGDTLTAPSIQARFLVLDSSRR